MQPDDIDKDILEYVANEEPWHILCGVFYHRFKDPAELVQRVFRLREEGLISISKGSRTSIEPNPDAFLTDARAHDWHEDSVVAEDSTWWDIVATEMGFEHVKKRFR
ncbi:MAG: hypothetical protein WA117_14230 [Verrucomicrobiia bacterium]